MPNHSHAQIISVSGGSIFTTVAGSGPPLLLLHGFPQTHLMWRDIAPLLASEFTVICADLRGYGASACPPSTPDHLPYSKRAMAAEMVELMEKFGFSEFMIGGHDRGGRVAYRMALDHPAVIRKLAVLDIVPTSTVWDQADDRFALGFWPWVLLAQAEPLPERLIAGAPEAVIDDALTGWGSSAAVFPPQIREAYVEALRSADHVHAICEEYRAAASVDRQHDVQDQIAGRRIRCPLMALWSGTGALATWYTNDGGPLALWQQFAGDVVGHSMPGGHFFPEEYPIETTKVLAEFFGDAAFSSG
ncbi:MULTISPECIES: alpha/beta fold hydrolase [unclassified Neorhizobium]|uniref:alpha/beta fold hydrolase n=1 Tax=unclassified Neorhizobium TaxID=2629175 RepID=UPI001FF1AEAE|nr:MULTISPECIES: alpha/beta hydrolase [unclassified Neorhizobium]MCJ9668473.1 alpha/beta hydrolase [Neorhizobium sp. SHOUNA12B]MCJ9743996.1 alpha/beta hydrolase [Neorhizobium sp. SHOUNA12A]